MDQATATVHPIAPDPVPACPTMKRGTLRAMLEGVTLTMSKDGTRPHLNGVLFRFEKESLLLVSTDGHRLTTVRSPYTLEAEGPEESKDLFIRAADALELLKMVKGPAKTAGDPVWLKPFPRLGGRLGFDATTPDSPSKLSLIDCDETFPPFDKVIPKKPSEDKDGAGNAFGVNGAYLGDVGKAARHLAGSPSGGVKFWAPQYEIASYDAGKRIPGPMCIDLESPELGTEALIVIMPLRI